jgi:DNA-binding CsgD family transcriptional regulator
VSCNQSGEKTLRGSDGLKIVGGILRATDGHADSQLKQVVLDAISAIQPVACRTALSVSRPSGKRPYQLIVAPIRNGLSAFAGMRSPHLVVLVIDPERPQRARRDDLVRLYGLTAREAAVASGLSEGKTIELVADELGITYETGRSHLRRILEKTGTRRQTEFILLMARLLMLSPEC